MIARFIDNLDIFVGVTADMRSSCYSIQKWLSHESYDHKVARLQAVHAVNKEAMVITGISAGGALAVRMLADYNDWHSAHLVCAKLLHADAIGSSFRKRAPALYEAVKYAENAIAAGLRVDGVTTFRALYDTVVPVKDSTFSDVQDKKIPLVGHTTAIVWYLLFKLPKLD